MKKIPTLFVRDYSGDRKVVNEVTPGCEWVIAGEGVATRKFDGTSCRFQEGKLWKRYELKNGKTPPEGFEPAQEKDATTGETPGWVPVGEGPEDKWHRAAETALAARLEDGTYELVGPKINGNPEKTVSHIFLRHGSGEWMEPERTYEGLKTYLQKRPSMEGIVFHHPDGRMAKIKRKDFA